MIKMKRNRKWKIPHTVLERRTLCLSSYKNHKLKVKLWWVGAHKRKKRAFFVPFFFSEGNFFNVLMCSVFVLFQCVVYWIHFQNVHTFTYQKTLPPTLFRLFLKSLKAFSVSLNPFSLRKANGIFTLCSNSLSKNRILILNK